MAEHFEKEIAHKAWDNVRLVLNQPYARNKQMGLEFIRFSGLQRVNKVSKHIPLCN